MATMGEVAPRGARDGGGSVDDQALIAAIRRRLLAEIEAGQHGGGHHRGDPVTIANNIYGAGAYGPGVHGSMSADDGGAAGDDSDYFVDILRETIPENGSAILRDPETGEKQTRFLPAGGWHKNVHRYKKKRVSP